MIKYIYIILLLFSCISFLHSQNDTRDLQKKQKEMLLKIEETTKKLDEADKNVAVSLQQLSALSQKVMLRKQYLAGINNEIADIEDEIFIVQEDTKELAESLDVEKQRYAQILKGLQKGNYFQNKLLFVLSAGSLTESYRRFEYLREIYAWQKKQLERINLSQQELVNKEKKLESKRSEKLALLSLQQTEDLKLFAEEKKQKAIVDDLQSKRNALQAELKKQQKEAIELNNAIEGVIAGEADLSVKNQEKENRTPVDNKGDYAMTAAEQNVSTSFEKSKGKLPFPVSGQYLITGRFGEQQYEELKQTTVTNGGINIQALSDTNVKAIYDGEVSAVFALSGYHNSIIIRHGDYLTVYANLASVSVKKGDKVKIGQTIGSIYSDADNGNIATLYFQIRKGKTKLNPEAWLRK